MPATPASPSAAGRAVRSWPPLAFVAAGIAAWLAALALTLPARLIVPRGSDAAGTVWHGAAGLPNGTTARWDWSPGDSLAHAALAATWTVDGPGTLLSGVARRSFAGIEFADVRGRAAWALLAAAAPGLPDCALTLDVALDTVSARAAGGSVRTLPGTCGAAGAAHPVPRLLATFAGAGGRVTAWTDRATPLATLALGGDRLALHVTAAGAALLGTRAGEIELAL